MITKQSNSEEIAEHRAKQRTTLENEEVDMDFWDSEEVTIVGPPISTDEARDNLQRGIHR